MKTVKIKKIEVKNFMGYAESTQLFDSQNTQIVAETGSGKTSYLQAVRFAFNLPTCYVQPHTENKTIIPDLETYVKITFEVDGLEYFIERVGKQEWKTDKDTGIKEFNGFKANDFNYDGKPCKSKDIVISIEELFGIKHKLLSYVLIADYFNTAVDWKDRRKFLFDTCGIDEMAQAVIAKEEYSLIANELKKGKTTEEIGKILNSEKKAINENRAKTETTIQVRTDDLTNASKYDFVAIEKELSKISTQLDRLLKAEKKEVKNEIVSSKLDEIAKLQEKINKFRQADMLASQEHRSECATQESKVRQLLAQWERLLDRNGASGEIVSHKRNIEHYTKRITELESLEFSGETTCTKCGQDLPSGDIETLVNAFNERKAKDLEISKGNFDYAKTELANAQASYDSLRNEYSEEKKVLDTLKAKELSLNTSEITALESDIETLNSEIANLKAKEVKADTADKVAELKAQQKELTMQLAYKNEVDRLNAEIERLNDTLMSLTDEESLNFKKRKQLADYEMEIINLANDTINSKFGGGLKFRLFKKLTATAEKQFDLDCEAELNGIAYDNLSTGQKIYANAMTVLGLQEILDINMFLFIDDRTSCTLPITATQQVIELLTKKGAKTNGTRIDVAYAKLIEKLQNNGKEDLPTVEVE